MILQFACCNILCTKVYGVKKKCVQTVFTFFCVDCIIGKWFFFLNPKVVIGVKVDCIHVDWFITLHHLSFFVFINVNIFTGVNELLTWETCVCYALLLLLSQRRISTLKYWIVRYHCYRRLYEQTMKVHLFDFITIQTAQLPMWWSLVRCKGCAVLFFVPIKCLPPVFQVR